MADAEARETCRQPNDPDVVAHQMKMAAVTMTPDERDGVAGER